MRAEHPECTFVREDGQAEVRLVSETEPSLQVQHIKRFLVSLKTVRKTKNRPVGSPATVLMQEQARSAIRDMFTSASLTYPEEWDGHLRPFIKGLKSIRRTRMSQGVLYVREAWGLAFSDRITHLPGLEKANEGRVQCPFEVYQKLGEYFLSTGEVFGHAYMSLTFNLMCRSENTKKLCFEHISVEGDSLSFLLPKVKSDQTGERKSTDDPRHVYANPLNPLVCPVLALGAYFAVNVELRPERLQLFGGGNYEDSRFGKVLKRALNDDTMKRVVRLVGKINPADIGTHSFRKGAVTYATSGCTGGPQITALILRAGWSLGGVQDRYFRYDAAGDYFVGRTLSGLPLDSHEFAMLPPHFDVTCVEVDDGIKMCFPYLYEREEFHPVLARCLASLVYHSEWLMTTFPNHPLMQTRLFRHREVLTRLRALVMCGMSSRFLRATGYPPLTTVLRRFRTLEERVADLPVDVANAVVGAFRRNGVFLNNVGVSEDRLREILDATFEARGFVTGGAVRREPLMEHVDGTDRVMTTVYEWPGDDNVHLLPFTFEFPKISVFGGWQLWIEGNPACGLPPFRRLRADDVSTRKQRKVLSEWKCLFGKIERAICNGCAELLGVERVDFNTLEGNAVKRVFDAVKDSVLPRNGVRKRNVEELHVTTVVKRIRALEEE